MKADSCPKKRILQVLNTRRWPASVYQYHSIPFNTIQYHSIPFNTNSIIGSIGIIGIKEPLRLALTAFTQKSDLAITADCLAPGLRAISSTVWRSSSIIVTLWAGWPSRCRNRSNPVGSQKDDDAAAIARPFHSRIWLQPLLVNGAWRNANYFLKK